MVLIVTEPSDVSSHIVAQYLTLIDVQYCYLYPNCFHDLFDFETLNKDIEKYTGIWLRSGLHFVSTANWNPAFDSQRKTLDDYIHFLFENVPNCIGSLQTEYHHNKLIDLKLAEACHLKIPTTYLIYNKYEY
mgnify:CR=1 FL=1